MQETIETQENQSIDNNSNDVQTPPSRRRKIAKVIVPLLLVIAAGSNSEVRTAINRAIDSINRAPKDEKANLDLILQAVPSNYRSPLAELLSHHEETGQGLDTRYLEVLIHNIANPATALEGMDNISIGDDVVEMLRSRSENPGTAAAIQTYASLPTTTPTSLNAFISRDTTIDPENLQNLATILQQRPNFSLDYEQPFQNDHLHVFSRLTTEEDVQKITGILARNPTISNETIYRIFESLLTINHHLLSDLEIDQLIQLDEAYHQEATTALHQDPRNDIVYLRNVISYLAPYKAVLGDRFLEFISSVTQQDLAQKDRIFALNYEPYNMYVDEIYSFPFERINLLRNNDLRQMIIDAFISGEITINGQKFVLTLDERIELFNRATSPAEESNFINLFNNKDPELLTNRDGIIFFIMMSRRLSRSEITIGEVQEIFNILIDDSIHISNRFRDIDLIVMNQLRQNIGNSSFSLLVDQLRQSDTASVQLSEISSLDDFQKFDHYSAAIKATGDDFLSAHPGFYSVLADLDVLDYLFPKDPDTTRNPRDSDTPIEAELASEQREAEVFEERMQILKAVFDFYQGNGVQTAEYTSLRNAMPMLGELLKLSLTPQQLARYLESIQELDVIPEDRAHILDETFHIFRVDEFTPEATTMRLSLVERINEQQLRENKFLPILLISGYSQDIVTELQQMSQEDFDAFTSKLALTYTALVEADFEVMDFYQYQILDYVFEEIKNRTAVADIVENVVSTISWISTLNESQKWGMSYDLFSDLVTSGFQFSQEMKAQYNLLISFINRLQPVLLKENQQLFELLRDPTFLALTQNKETQENMIIDFVLELITAFEIAKRQDVILRDFRSQAVAELAQTYFDQTHGAKALYTYLMDSVYPDFEAQGVTLLEFLGLNLSEQIVSITKDPTLPNDFLDRFVDMTLAVFLQIKHSVRPIQVPTESITPAVYETLLEARTPFELFATHFVPLENLEGRVRVAELDPTSLEVRSENDLNNPGLGIIVGTPSRTTISGDIHTGRTTIVERFTTSLSERSNSPVDITGSHSLVYDLNGILMVRTEQMPGDKLVFSANAIYSGNPSGGNEVSEEDQRSILSAMRRNGDSGLLVILNFKSQSKAFMVSFAPGAIATGVDVMALIAELYEQNPEALGLSILPTSGPVSAETQINGDGLFFQDYFLTRSDNEILTPAFMTARLFP